MTSSVNVRDGPRPRVTLDTTGGEVRECYRSAAQRGLLLADFGGLESERLRRLALFHNAADATASQVGGLCETLAPLRGS